jgi:hypothetical protein
VRVWRLGTHAIGPASDETDGALPGRGRSPRVTDSLITAAGRERSLRGAWIRSVP